MPDGMPYYIEKGPTLRLMERSLNSRSRAQREATLRRLCDDRLPLQQWLLADDAWNQQEFQDHRRRPNIPIDQTIPVERRIARDWFGYILQGGQNDPVLPPAPQPTTGYWIAYRGQVEAIVRQTLCWALQVSLGRDGAAAAGGAARPDPPWDIELFWNCPANWFEGWVISRTIDPPGLRDTPQRARGLVTVIFMTPAHRGSVVAQSPLAVREKATTVNDPNPVPSWEFNYEKLGQPPRYAPGPVPLGRDRRYATWVVTHARHRLYDPVGNEIKTTNSVGSTTLGTSLEKPLGAVYSGYKPMSNDAEGIVVVAPSMPSGGVREDGSVAP